MQREQEQKDGRLEQKTYQEVVTDAPHHAERLHAERPAILDGEEVLSYRRVADDCRRTAGVLASRGVGRGDRVAVLLLNRREYLELYFAVAVCTERPLTINRSLGGRSPDLRGDSLGGAKIDA